MFVRQVIQTNKAFTFTGHEQFIRDKTERHGTEISGKADIPGRKITENIYLCPDGKYRWVYELSMHRNPVILFTVFRVLLTALLSVAAFVFILTVIEGELFSVHISDMEKKGLIVISAAFLLCIPAAYLTVAASKGFRYCVLFEMDEKSITHKELPGSFKKTQVLSRLAVIIGAAADRPGTAGAGLLASAKNTAVTEFCKIKRIRVIKAFHTIKLDAAFNHNQIYAEPEDFGFVLSFIKERLPGNIPDGRR